MEIVEVKNQKDSNVLRIEFMIGNTYNYSCWYCFKGSYEGTHRWNNDYNLVIQNFYHLLDHYKANGKTKFELHIIGGEPTLWPKLGDFVKDIKQNYDCVISISTNGTRTIRWWNQYADFFDFVILSIHYERADTEHLKNVADIIHKKNKIVNAIVLMDPKNWHKCLNIIEDLKDSKHNWFINTSEIIHDTVMYTKEQIDFLSTPAKRYPDTKWLKQNQHLFLKDIIVKFEDGSEKIVKKNWINLNQKNQFKGWLCNIGVDNIFINKEGRITGTCGTKLFDDYNIYSNDFIDIFNPDIKPKICDVDFCMCQPEQNLNKTKHF